MMMQEFIITEIIKRVSYRSYAFNMSNNYYDDEDDEYDEDDFGMLTIYQLTRNYMMIHLIIKKIMRPKLNEYTLRR